MQRTQEGSTGVDSLVLVRLQNASVEKWIGMASKGRDGIVLLYCIGVAKAMKQTQIENTSKKLLLVCIRDVAYTPM